MKTNYIHKLISILLFNCLLFSTSAIDLNQPSGSFSVSGSNYVDGMNLEWNINTGVNKPILLNYTIETEEECDYVEIFSVDNNGIASSSPMYSYSGSLGSGSLSTVIPNGRVKVIFYSDGSVNNTDGYYGFDINFSVDNSFTTVENSYTTSNSYINGSLGINTISPREKLDVNGNAIIQSKLGVGSSPYYHSKFSVFNSTDDVSQYITNNKSSANSIYGIQSYTNNSSGNTYGVYSSVSGQTGKKWAGYFTGGDVAVVSGNIGVGVDNPKGILQVRGIYDNSWIYFSSNAGMNSIKYNPKVGYGLAFTWNYSGGQEESIINYSGGPNARLDFTSWDATNLTTEMTLKKGSLGIGTTTPDSKLHVLVPGSSNPINAMSIDVSSFNSNENARISSYFKVTDIGGNNTPFIIKGDGKVGIGITNIKTNALLTVNGIIHAKEINVSLEGLADYVFHPDYELMPLHKVEQFVKTNRHLPEIPSATEVKENGLNMGEMQNKLLQKIEELTLYMIDQQKRIEELKDEIEELKRK